MVLQLRPAVESDSARIGYIGRDAFQLNLGRSLFPAHLAHKSKTGDLRRDEAEWRAARNVRRMRSGQLTFVVVDIPEDGSEGEEVVVGFAQWELPTESDRSTDTKELDEVNQDPPPPTLDQDALREIFEVINTEAKKWLGPEGHSKMWYLMVLAIDPAHQRRGIGKMLMRHGLSLVAEARREAFLVATPEGRGMYEAMGFRQIGEPCTLANTPHYSMLWRRPDSESS
ncbi:hypothetical protein N0V88_003352 [Collariella sp. IMI 366227]|nr:hypothetical protein N0V88_003352 [Collariella sp. IMI 366227]